MCSYHLSIEAAVDEEHRDVVNFLQFLRILKCIEPRSLVNVVDEETQTLRKQQALNPTSHTLNCKAQPLDPETTNAKP